MVWWLVLRMLVWLSSGSVVGNISVLGWRREVCIICSRHAADSHEIPFSPSLGKRMYSTHAVLYTVDGWCWLALRESSYSGWV